MNIKREVARKYYITGQEDHRVELRCIRLYCGKLLTTEIGLDVVEILNIIKHHETKCRGEM